MKEKDDRFFPLAALERISRPLLQLLSILLIVASLWGLVNQLTLWNQPVELVFGTPGAVKEELLDGRARYWLEFTQQETGERLILRLRNNSPVLKYLLTASPTDSVALRYWTDDLTILEVHPLVYGVPPIRDRIPPSGILFGTSVLGLVVALVLLFPGTLDRIFRQVIRRSGRR